MSLVPTPPVFVQPVIFGEGEALDKIAGYGIAAVCHCVGLEEARLQDVPLFRLDWDLMFEQRPGLGGRAAIFVESFDRLEQLFGLCRATRRSFSFAVSSKG